MDFERVMSAVAIVRTHLNLTADMSTPIGIVLGSGLSGFAAQVLQSSSACEVNYGAIAGFPTSSVPGHKGRLVFGHVANIPVIIMDGRVHCYEGYSAKEVAFGMRLFKILGVKSVILTNASGGIDISFEPGDIMIIKDHLNLTGQNPLIGSNDERFGPRFFDMSQAYAPHLINLTKTIAHEHHIHLREGVFAGVLGPNYETPAEIRMLDKLGASAVAMSTVLETIAARHLGIEVLGLSCISNKAAGLSSTPLTHEEVKESTYKVSEKFNTLLNTIIPAFAQHYQRQEA